MAISLLTLIVIISIVLLLKRQYNFDGIDAVGIITICFVILVFPINIIGSAITKEYKEVKQEYRIVASKADTRVEGELHGCFYVKGRIDEVDYYFYLMKRNGVYKQGRVEVNNTVIKETTKTPYVKKMKTYVVFPVSNWICFSPGDCLQEERDTIFVPVGTVENSSSFSVF